MVNCKSESSVNKIIAEGKTQDPSVSASGFQIVTMALADCARNKYEGNPKCAFKCNHIGSHAAIKLLVFSCCFMKFSFRTPSKARTCTTCLFILHLSTRLG